MLVGLFPNKGFFWSMLRLNFPLFWFYGINWPGFLFDYLSGNKFVTGLVYEILSLSSSSSSDFWMMMELTRVSLAGRFVAGLCSGTAFVKSFRKYTNRSLFISEYFLYLNPALYYLSGYRYVKFFIFSKHSLFLSTMSKMSAEVSSLKSLFWKLVV